MMQQPSTSILNSDCDSHRSEARATNSFTCPRLMLQHQPPHPSAAAAACVWLISRGQTTRCEAQRRWQTVHVGQPVALTAAERGGRGRDEEKDGGRDGEAHNPHPHSHSQSCRLQITRKWLHLINVASGRGGINPLPCCAVGLKRWMLDKLKRARASPDLLYHSVAVQGSGVPGEIKAPEPLFMQQDALIKQYVNMHIINPRLTILKAEVKWNN